MKRLYIAIFLLILPSLFFWLGYEIGFRKANSKIKVNTELAKVTLESHEKRMDTIRTESDSAANKRFLQNFGTGY